MADFRTKQTIDPQAFANVLQRKAAIEQEQANIDRQRKDARFKQITDAVVAGQTIASNMMTMAEQRGKIKKQQTEAEGRQELAALFTEPDALPEPTLDPETNSGILELKKADKQKRFLEAAVKSGLPTEKLLELQKVKEVKSGDRDLAKLSVKFKGAKDRTPIWAVYDKVAGRVFDRGVDITDQLEDSPQPTYSDAVVEDLEGRKGLLDKTTGNVRGVFGEQRAGVEGKATRIQFTPEERKQVMAARNEFQNHDYIKKFSAVAPDISLLEELIEKNPKGAIGPVKTQISKQVAGEVGRLTDEDISRNSPTPDVAENVKQWVKKVNSGDFTDITRERYGIILNIVQRKRAEEAGKILDDVVTDTVGFEVTNANKEALRNAIGRGITPYIDKYKKGKANSTDAQVDQFFQSLY